jgi:parvulin-like peptidyl-prolyl isomerase
MTAPINRFGWALAIALGALVAIWLATSSFAQEPRSAKSASTPSGPASDSKKGSFPSPGADREVAAHVNGKPISKADVEQALTVLARGGQVQATPQAMAGALSQIINQRLLFDFIEKEGLIATKDEVDKSVDLVLKKNPALEPQLRDRRNMEAFRNQMQAELSRQKFYQKYSTEKQIQAFFDSHAKHFDGTKLRVSHILLRPAQNGSPPEAAELFAEAQRIKSEIEAGTMTFADAAKKYSSGPSRQEGGDLGFIERGGPMVEQFNSAAYALEPGKISEPVPSPFGVHLITVTDTKAGEKKLTDTDVRTRVVQALAQWLVAKLLERELKTPGKVEFSEGFPHFKPGTQELVPAEK